MRTYDDWKTTNPDDSNVEAVCRNCKVAFDNLVLHNGAWWCRACLEDDESAAHYEPKD